MPGINRMLRGSTLVETLVMMLVAGIVFLSVMDGLALFTRLQAQRTEALLSAGREANGYYRIAALTDNADSAGSYADDIELFRNGTRSALLLRDSALVFSSGEFCDTLMTGVISLHLRQHDLQVDTIEITLSTGFTARVPVPVSPREQHGQSVKQIEDEYDYSEK